MSPRLSKLILIAGLALLPACESELSTAPRSGSPDPAVLARAFRIDINVETGEVRVVNPGGAVRAGGPIRPAFSLMGAEVVGLTVSNVIRSPIGLFVPNKRSIRFDLALTNRLSVTDMVTPTFPIPPAGVQGVIAFPYTVAATGVAGGKATADVTWNGTGVAPSGAPFSFFNDLATCPAGATSDCYRWEAFVSPLAPGVTTAAQRVGFTVDPGVTSVQVYVVVAADLLDHPPVPVPGKGAVLGVVSSPATGLLSGVTVTASPGGASATTDGIGKYLLTGLDVGAVTLTLSGLPTGCSDPGSQVITVISGGVATGDFTVACVPPFGNISGTVTSRQLGPISGNGVEVAVISPYEIFSTQTDGSGFYKFTNVPAGDIIVSLANRPAGCADPGSILLTVLPGGTFTADFDLDCGSAPGSITGTVTSPQLGPVAGHDVEFIVVQTSVTAMTLTDANGEYGFTNVPPGDIIVSMANRPAGCADPGSVLLTMVPAASMVANFTLDCPGVGVSGVTGIVNSTFGPLTGIMVRIENPSTGLLIDTGTDVDGSYRFGPLTPGTATVSITNTPAMCSAPGSQQVTMPAGSTAVVNFSIACFVALGSISGSVASPELGPLAGVLVYWLHSSDVIGATFTDANGNYSFPNVPAGGLSVIVERVPAPCVNPPSQFVNATPSGVVADFTVSCTPLTGSVSGLVTSVDRGPLAGVFVVWQQGSLYDFTTTDANGAYSLANVPTGTVDVFIQPPTGCLVAGQTVTVPPGSNLIVNLAVDCSSNAITGTVTSPEIGALGGVTVGLYFPGSSLPVLITTTMTDQAGGYSFFNLLSGTYLVLLSNLPQGCANPFPLGQVVTIQPNTNPVAPFSVTCN